MACSAAVRLCSLSRRRESNRVNVVYQIKLSMPRSIGFEHGIEGWGEGGGVSEGRGVVEAPRLVEIENWIGDWERREAASARRLLGLQLGQPPHSRLQRLLLLGETEADHFLVEPIAIES
ncbi:hypothetical protein ABIE13_005269 [Ottowia thiooxydans]|uniref:Uncharacterized protein n=1 Tax=Ottowia thiooxydans TaxID=219182 RepID=A0ABV2QGG4_9BURK